LATAAKFSKEREKPLMAAAAIKKRERSEISLATSAKFSKERERERPLMAATAKFLNREGGGHSFKIREKLKKKKFQQEC
jgi:hypothetical protein